MMMGCDAKKEKKKKWGKAIKSEVAVKYAEGYSVAVAVAAAVAVAVSAAVSVSVAVEIWVRVAVSGLRPCPVDTIPDGPDENSISV